MDERFDRFVFLIVRPGYLTAEFASERRASYVTPIRLFLFASILLTFLLTISIDPQEMRDMTRSLEDGRSSPAPRAIEDDVVRHFIDVLDVRHRMQVRDILRRPEESPSRGAVTLIAHLVGERSLDEGMVRQLVVNAIELLHSPHRIAGAIVENVPIAMFILLPWFTVLLALFYVFQRRYLIHHIVFAFHLHTFMFLVFSVMLLIPEPVVAETAETAATQDDENISLMQTLYTYTQLALFLGILVNSYAAVKRFYGQGYVATTLKFFAIGLLYGAMLSPTMLFVLVFTVYTY